MAIDPDALKAIIRAAVTAATASQTDSNRAIVEAAVNAAAANHTTAQQNMRRPTLPPFEPKHIEGWLRRVEAAFDRLSITSPRLKLANLDEKLNSDSDPRINEYICADPTQENYDELIAYLRRKHGRTTEMKAASVIEGTEREGRTPSQLWSVMKDKADNVTLDEIMKEQLLRRLPADVRTHLTDKIEGKSGKEVAELADKYFDQDGKLKNKSSASGINAVTSKSALKHDRLPTRPSTSHASAHTAETTNYTSAFEPDDDPDINAVRFRQRQKQRFNVNNSGGSGKLYALCYLESSASATICK